MASKKANKKTQVVEAVVPAAAGKSADLVSPASKNSEKSGVEVQAEEMKVQLKELEDAAKQGSKKSKDVEEKRENNDESGGPEEGVVDRKVFYPVRGGARGRGSRNPVNRVNEEERGYNKPQSRGGRGRGNSNFRGGSRNSESRGDKNTNKTPSTWHRVITHKSDEAWSHFLAKTQGSDIKHYLVTASKVKGEPRYAHPQEDEITSDLCFSVGGRKGGEIYLVRGREYYISLAPGSANLVLSFTRSCVSAKNPISWLPSLSPGQTLHVRVNSAFPNLLYYQDSKEKFLGGPVVVVRNFNFKNNSKKKESDGDCESSDDEASSATQYDE